MSSVAKPVAKKPRKARKVAAPPKSVSFKSRGPHKCVRVDGRSQRGLHDALWRLTGKFDYAQAEKSGTLRALPMPLPDQRFLAPCTGKAASKFPPGSAAKQGSKLDSQVRV